MHWPTLAFQKKSRLSAALFYLRGYCSQLLSRAARRSVLGANSGEVSFAAPSAVDSASPSNHAGSNLCRGVAAQRGNNVRVTGTADINLRYAGTRGQRLSALCCLGGIDDI